MEKLYNLDQESDIWASTCKQIMLEMSSLIKIIKIFVNLARLDQEITVQNRSNCRCPVGEKIDSTVLANQIDGHSQAAVKNNKDFAF